MSQHFAHVAASAAPVFDQTADVHQISQGFYDPARAAAAGDPYAGNVPYSIAGMPVADRLSFYFLGKCDISVPETIDRAVSNDIRGDGCRPLPEPHGAAAWSSGVVMLALLRWVRHGAGLRRRRSSRKRSAASIRRR